MMGRKSVLLTFSFLAGLVVLSSVAYACTFVQGTMSATGDGGGSVTAIGSGGQEVGNDIMQWCSETGSTSISTPLGTVHIAISPYAGDPNGNALCKPASQLPDTGALAGPPSTNPSNPTGLGAPQVYTVTWSDTAVEPDCMNQSFPRTTVHPLVNVTPSTQVGGGSVGVGLHGSVQNSEFLIQNGSGSGDYLLDSTGLTPSNGSLCVSDVLGGRGNMVHFTFV